MNNAVIVGAGIFGSTVARVLAENNWNVKVVESRSFVGGNCHSHYEDGMEVHDYGPHIFHTSNSVVWEFVNRFAQFNGYEHHVVALHDGVPYFLPFNLSMIAQFFNLKGKDATPEGAMEFMEGLKVKNSNPSNFEEYAIANIGTDLYNAFVRNYTKKQWNRDPKELPASIIKRLPIRYSFNISYYDDIHQGIPVQGYTKMIENMLNHENISVELNHRYYRQELEKDISEGSIVVYTGSIDELMDYERGNLEYRSLRFDNKVMNVRDFQGNSIVNHVDDDVQFTRITEFKHFHPEDKDILNSDRTVIQYEYPETYDGYNERYYPIDNAKNNESWMKYYSQAEYLYQGKLILGGRLGLYRYFDMDDSIAEAILLAERMVQDN